MTLWVLIFFHIYSVFGEVNCRSISHSEIQDIRKCQENFVNSNCQQFNDRGVEFPLTDCSPEDVKRTISVTDILRSCYHGTKNGFSEMMEALPAIPGAVKKKIDEDSKRIDENIKICSTAADYLKAKEEDKSQSWFSMGLSSSEKLMTECLERLNQEQTKDNVRVEEWTVDKLQKFKSALSCFRWDARFYVACPLAASLGVGKVVSVLAKSMEMNLLVEVSAKYSDRAAGKLALRRLDQMAEKALSKAESKAVTQAEKYSVAHQRDLIRLLRTDRFRQIVRELGINERALWKGALDSDLGKLDFFWRHNILDNTTKSKNFVDTLRGAKGNTPAGKALREMLDESGYAGKNILPEGLPTEKVIEVFQNNPMLRNYLHEIPGMSDAVDDLNSGLINSAEFKERIKANLFHNGPSEGFWKFFSETLVNGQVQAGAEGSVGKIFKGTIWEGGEKTLDGGKVVHLTKYSKPFAQGTLHTLADRMSQATRGGILKIYHEVGGKVLKETPKIPIGQLNANGLNGIQLLKDLLVQNSQQTLKQLEVLAEHAGTLAEYDAVKRKTIQDLIESGKARIAQQQKFIADNVEFADDGKSLRIKNGGKWESIDATRPTDDVLARVENLLRHEEGQNGNPMDAVAKAKLTFPEMALPAAFGLKALFSKCPKLTQPPEIRAVK